MSTRTAELLMAITMAAFSAYLMWNSTELPIGWLPGEGPGGGFWPFWLAAVMLASCGWIIVNWLRRVSPPSKSKLPFFEPGVLSSVGPAAAALILTVILFDGAGLPGFDGLGVYLALPLFLAFYMKVMGRHSWLATIVTMVSVPIVTFVFFEAMLSITLPKGVTEPYFEPIYARVYQCPTQPSWSAKLNCFVFLDQP